MQSGLGAGAANQELDRSAGRLTSMHILRILGNISKKKNAFVKVQPCVEMFVKKKRRKKTRKIIQ